MRDLRANLKAHFDALHDDMDILLVPRQGSKKAVVIMTLSQYNSMVETEYLLSTEDNRNVLDKALKELEQGDCS